MLLKMFLVRQKAMRSLDIRLEDGEALGRGDSGGSSAIEGGRGVSRGAGASHGHPAVCAL
jgi:hypothetical protein